MPVRFRSGVDPWSDTYRRPSRVTAPQSGLVDTLPPGSDAVVPVWGCPSSQRPAALSLHRPEADTRSSGTRCRTRRGWSDPPRWRGSCCSRVSTVASVIMRPRSNPSLGLMTTFFSGKRQVPQYLEKAGLLGVHVQLLPLAAMLFCDAVGFDRGHSIFILPRYAAMSSTRITAPCFLSRSPVISSMPRHQIVDVFLRNHRKERLAVVLALVHESDEIREQRHVGDVIAPCPPDSMIVAPSIPSSMRSSRMR